MTASYDTDPNTQTIAAAWASSELGQPEREVRYGFATTGPTESVTASEEEPTARRVMVAAGLACGVAAGALLGVMLFTYNDSSEPTVVAPGPAPQHAVVVGPNTAAPTPKPVVSEQSTAPTAVIPAPRVQPPMADVATPPPASKGDTTVVVDVPIPDYPPLPEQPGQHDPEDPKPEPPTFVPDLPLSPKPPKPPVVIDPAFGP